MTKRRNPSSNLSSNPNAALQNKPAGSPLGLIAGWGEFPALVAREARALGMRIYAVGFFEETEEALAKGVDELHWVRLGELGKVLKYFKSRKVEQAIMAGLIRHKQLFANLKMDWHAVKLLTSLRDKRADSILGAVANLLAEHGIELVSPLPILKNYLPTIGVLTRRKPSIQERKDIEFGHQIAKHIAGADIGQTVVVRDQAVVAVEAMEGTDACIVRSGRYAKKGAVVVKVTKPSQDLRFDTPVIGPRTITSMVKANARVLAFDSEKTLFLNKEETIEKANAHGITLVAL